MSMKPSGRSLALGIVICAVSLLTIAGVLALLGVDDLAGLPVLSVGNFVRGYLAAGQFAAGIFASGTFAIGVFAAGIFGIFSIGVFSIGIFSIGTFSIGLFVLGIFVIGMPVAQRETNSSQPDGRSDESAEVGRPEGASLR